MRLVARIIPQVLITLALLAFVGSGGGFIRELSGPVAAADDAIENLIASPSVRRASLDEIRRAVAGGEYVARTAGEVVQLLDANGTLSADVLRAPQIRRAEYNARLDENRLVDGTVVLQLDDRSDDASVILGQTNLEELSFTAGDADVPLAALSDGRLSLLVSDDDQSAISGHWQATGRSGADGTSFELRLPDSSVCHIRILTPLGVTVHSPNAVVRSERVGEEVFWDMFPDSGRPISVVCLSEEDRLAQAKDSIAAVDSMFRVTEQTVLFTWAIVIPSHFAGAEVSLNLADDCQVSSVSSDPGNPVKWEVHRDAEPTLLMENLQGAQTITIHGESSQTAKHRIKLPLLNRGDWRAASGQVGALVMRSSGVRMVIARHLAIDDLQLKGLYQHDVSFGSNGDQIVELRQFAVDSAASLNVVKTRSTAGQLMLVDYPLESTGEVSVYVEIEPRSGRIYDVEWNLAGRWKPTLVTDMRSNESLYFTTTPGLQSGDQNLAIALRAFASVNQSAQLQIRFRSTEAVRADKFSVPILSNPEYRSSECWIFSSGGTAYPEHVQATVVPDAEQAIRQRFPWVADSLSFDSTRELVQTAPLSTGAEQSNESSQATIRARTDYAIQRTGDQIVENIRLRLNSEGELPRSVIIVFPSGVDVRVADQESGFRVTRTSRQTEDGDREWLLMLPTGRRLSTDTTVGLRVIRREGIADYAAVPRLPEIRDTTVTARVVTGVESAGYRVALIADSGATGAAESTMLESGHPVLLSQSGSRFLLRMTRDQAAENFLGIRGRIYCAFNPVDESGRCRCFADLVVSRLGATRVLPVQWAELPDAQFYVDDREVWCPPTENSTSVFLPADQPTCRLRMIWTSATTFGGQLHQSAQVALPQFKTADTAHLVNMVQILEDEYSPVRSSGWSVLDSADVPETVALLASNATEGPVRDFLIRWQLAEQHGARVAVVPSADGVVRFSVPKQRLLWIGALVSFCLVLAIQSRIRSLSLGARIGLLTTGIAVSAFGSIEAAWWISGANVGLAVVVCLHQLVGPAIRRLQRLHPADAAQQGANVSAMTASLLAVMLTGQAPPMAEAPAVLLPDETESDDSTVFVRKKLLDAISVTSQPAGHVRVMQVNAEIQAGDDGNSQMTIRASVASRGEPSAGIFALPIEDATLTDCFLDGVRVAPIADESGRPAVVIPAGLPSVGGETSEKERNGADAGELGSIERGFEQWQTNVIEYVIRSRMDVMAGRRNLRVPLPNSARCQIALQTKGEFVRSVWLTGSARLPEIDSQSGRYVFPPLFNHGSVDLTIESNQSSVAEAESKAAAVMTCLAEIDFSKSRERLLCQYQLTSQSQAPLATEVQIPEVPGFTLVECRGQDGQPLRIRSADGLLLVGDGSFPQEEFDVTWEARLGPIIAGHTIPAEALLPPTECSVERIFIGLRVADPFEVSPLMAENPDLNVVASADEEYAGLNLSPADLVFAVREKAGDIPLPLVLKSDQQRVEMTQQVVAGVDELSISCRCDIRTGGARVFRQRLQVPAGLLIDQIEVSSGGTERLRSHSCQDGVLLVTLREGTLGNFRLSFTGVLPVPPGGRSEFTPMTIKDSIVQSTLQLSAGDATTVQLMNVGGMEENDPGVAMELPYTLSANPMRFNVVDAGRAVVLQMRTQEMASSQIAVLMHDGASDDSCDVAIQIAAGDQGWAGALPAMQELSFRRADWIHDGMSTWLQSGTGKLPPGRLDPGESGVLLLNGLKAQEDASVFRLRIPVPDPAVNMKGVRVLHQKTMAPVSRPDCAAWMVRSFDIPDVPLPDGLDDRSQAATWDETTSTLRITGVRTTEQATVPVTRELNRIVSVTDLRVSGDFLSGRSDFLLDFGDALETQLQLPEGLRLTQCCLDGRDLTLQAEDSVIQINREKDVQRLILEWTLPSRRAGFLPQRHKLVFPMGESMKTEHYVLLHPPEAESWSPDGSMTAITAAQLETRLNSSLQQFGSLDASTPTSGEGAGANAEPVSDPLADVYLRSYQSSLPRMVKAYELETAAEAGVIYRRRIPWPQWIPITALLVLGFVATSRKIVSRQSAEHGHFREEPSSSSEAAVSGADDSWQNSANADLPSDRGDANK